MAAVAGEAKAENTRDWYNTVEYHENYSGNLYIVQNLMFIVIAKETNFLCLGYQYHQTSITTIRIIIAMLCQQNNGGNSCFQKPVYCL